MYLAQVEVFFFFFSLFNKDLLFLSLGIRASFPIQNFPRKNG